MLLKPEIVHGTVVFIEHLSKKYKFNIKQTNIIFLVNLTVKYHLL
ncbi:hypothetical protein Slin_3743 [Spirosoma linguale DSM 74]|uniref:Uncharacterized protein n=1 Tax=Spirosoma linguale (strain ATCC 33905 / DSM 74 / LMG 10896 / Claus 1) TaxID=504472 RepID=D2QC06_SPILD|nr:hypothetical protein Slin_3743 [Spirosoma linguale DSM 74]